MRLRVPLAARIGLGMILLGIAGYHGIQHWMSTRIVTAVRMPVSLAAGHIRTGPFRLNLRSQYWVTVDPGEWWSADRQCDPGPALQTRWTLYRQGKVVDRQDEPTRYSTTFAAGPGVYDLDVEVLSDRRCLDPGHPYLEVLADTGYYDSGAFFLKVAATASVFLGVVISVFLPVVRIARPPAEIPRLTESASVGQNFQWARRLPLRRPISGLPGFGLVGGIISAIFGMVMMMLILPITPKGLSVHLLKPGAVPAKSDAWTEPLIVWVKDAGQGREPRLILNSREVAWEDLDLALKQELGRRRDWVVYVGGDDAVSWQHVVNVMDVARSDQAKVFLITGDTGKTQ